MWRRIIGLLVCAVVLYGVAPAILQVLDGWPEVVSYWLALPAGGAAYLYHRRRVRAGDVSVPRVAASG